MAGSTPPPVSGNAPAPLSAADPRRLGKYEIIGRLGQGGMGTVFLGRSPEGTPVAIKVIKPELAEAPEFRGRFRREAESARRVRRFTTAAVLDADPDGPNPYLVTEYVEGPTLSKMVARRGPLRPADLEQLALSVATALSAIHAAGIVHRDLTPANVLLSPVGPKVIDFGLARDFDGSGEFSRTARHAIGTPGYMAPEQILDSPVTSAADIFAWGAITIFAATGRPPFGEGRIEALLYRILYEPANIDGVPAELAPLVDAALQKEPDRRPTAEALRAALMSGGDLVPGIAALGTGPAAGQAPAPGQEADRDAKEGSRRRRGHLFGRGGRGLGAEDAPVTATPGTTSRPGPTSVATGLLTPPPTQTPPPTPATTSRPPATTSRAPSAPGTATPRPPATPSSPLPAPPGGARPGAGPAARSGGPVGTPSRGPGAAPSRPPVPPVPGGPPPASRAPSRRRPSPAGGQRSARVTGPRLRSAGRRRRRRRSRARAGQASPIRAMTAPSGAPAGAR
ncbi:serine/threonine-protein kinase [Pseudofrankia saprophytica]|uniref:serine/threonine-protein kinase n=1 Tax=Pseudofrankia saprophytica TaxID=298655 RepID=UPI000234C55F|nr:serine/threonine-protein kinase [Pseudofrankia saprophytica]